MIRLRRRYIIAVHRWLGLLSGIFLAVLALSGLALNHTEFLGLDRVQLANPLVMKRYGMATAGEISSFRINEANTLQVCRGMLFINRKPTGLTGSPVGVWSGDRLLAVATEKHVILLDHGGEIIEIYDPARLPATPLEAIGMDPEGRAVLVAGSASWTADPDWMEFAPFMGDLVEMSKLESVMCSPDDSEALLKSIQGEGITLYRLMLDLHSGRLFGISGRTVMDLTAVAILVLISSGILAYIRGRRP